MALSERFEMRLDEDTIQRVDAWRSNQSDLPSRAEAMRRLVEIGLAPQSPVNVHFSDGEKMLILMMNDLFKHLKMDDSVAGSEFMAEVIRGGHYWAPRWQFQGVFHENRDSHADVSFVNNALEMWSTIEFSFNKLSKKDRDRVAAEGGPLAKNPRFRGFDGNYEPALISIAHLLIDKMDRFASFKGRDLNSHAPSVEGYRRMLQVYAPFNKSLMGHELSANHLISVLKAQVRS